MADIRANGVSDVVAERWKDVQTMLGTTTNTQAVTAMIDILWLQFCSSNWTDIQNKAARLITAHKNFTTPMMGAEIKKVELDGSGAIVWRRGEGQPYRIPLKAWEKG